MKNLTWKIRSINDIGIVILLTFNFSLLIFLSGCMYSFSGSSVPKHLKTIAVPLFEDQSGFGEPGLAESFTTTLINLFVNDNSLEVAERNTADSILEGSIGISPRCAPGCDTGRTSDHAAGDGQRPRHVSRLKAAEEGVG